MRFTVEEGHALTFARAIEDTPPRRGEVAAPTFTACTAQHDPEHMRGLRPAGVLAELMAGGATVLHAEQSFEYLAPVRVGETFEVREQVGRAWTKTNRTGGLLTFTEIVKELRDASGAVVLRSTMVLVSL